MLKNRLDAAHTVRDVYVPLKRATADLSRKAGSCFAVMSEQRTKAGFTRPGFGARPIALVAKAAALLAEAEACLAEAHPELGQMIVEAGLDRFYEYGAGPDDTPSPRMPSEVLQLPRAA